MLVGFAGSMAFAYLRTEVRQNLVLLREAVVVRVHPFVGDERVVAADRAGTGDFERVQLAGVVGIRGARNRLSSFVESDGRADTRRDTSFQLIEGPPPANDSDGSRSGNIVFAGATLAPFSAFWRSQRRPPLTVSRPRL